MDYPLKFLKIEVKEFCSNNLNYEYINKCFSEAGFKRISDSEPYSRRNLVEEYYSSVNWEENNNIQKFYQAIRNILLKTPWLSEESRKNLINTCHELDFNIDSYEEFYLNSNLFNHQFPAGLPFGTIKPNFYVKAQKGSQTLKFEWQNGLGIITNNVYPSLNFQNLAKNFNCTPETDIALRKALRDMNQTECEKKFFLQYARTFKMAIDNIPVLIPQAWIQWHSLVKKELTLCYNLHADDIYRVDFVAFWNNRRFAIEIDDISHYAEKKGNWIADERKYSKSLKNQRSLIKEGWDVFRFSNWEIKNDELLTEALHDLKNFLKF